MKSPFSIESDPFVALEMREPEDAFEFGEEQLFESPPGGRRIQDRTGLTPRDIRKAVRDMRKVYALVLHQMAFSRGNNNARYDTATAHFAILPDGQILQLHPLNALLWASNGFNSGSVAVEFVGNFPNTKGKCWSPKKFGCHRVTPEQIEAGRYLVDHLIATMALTHILAHRQSSATRENDPGPDIWYHVGQWAIENRGLKDGGLGFKVGGGNPIPDAWRNWGLAGGSVTPEMETTEDFEWEEESPEPDLAREIGLGEFESEAGRYNSAVGERDTSFDEFEVLASEVPKTLALTNRRTSKRTMPQTACASYEKGEIQKSWTAQGHLASDVIAHARGLLIADFGVDWRTPRESLKREKALQDWLATIAQVIHGNPATTIRILGFSDCVGNERNNHLLRHGRAVRVFALLLQMLGSGPQWKSIKSKIKVVDAAPAGEYVSSNATVEGRAQNRGVLIESMRTLDFKPQVVHSCTVRPSQATTYPLLGLIPNIPDYRKYVPINYKLNAKKIVGEVAQDVSSKGESAHFWIEMLHFGLIAAEIFAETSILVAGLAIAGPVLTLAGGFLALGLSCLKPAEEAAARWSATGFSRGVVMGADQAPAQLVKDYFGNDYFEKDNFCPQVRDVRIANYKMGLLAGYVQGRLLCPNQLVIFWRDLGHRMGDQSYRGDSKRWARRAWIDWYVTVAATFTAHHLL
jgi:outer membrane protein OmpA-like peptidoglycan-associated protein